MNPSEERVNAMKYETPVLLLVGPASSLVLGVGWYGPPDRLPESGFIKPNDIVEGLDE